VAAILIRHRAAKRRVNFGCPPLRTPRGLAARVLTAQHVEVAPSIVNNNPETMERSRRSVPTAAGWFFVLMKDRRRGRAQREPGPITEDRGYGFRFSEDDPSRVRWVRFAKMRGSPLSCPRPLRAYGPIHLSNSPSRSRDACLRPGFATLLRSPEPRGGRSAERRSGARRNTRGAYHDAIRQAPGEAPCVS
jgi:hypothetical protein